MQILNEQIRERAGDKVGSPFQSDRSFRQRRRKAESLSMAMAVRWALIGVAGLWAAQFLPW